jgi:hypothetical protein
MKVLVAGATSRQANPDASDVAKKEVAFSWLLAEALRSLGYEVEHRNPTILESYEDFDHVFIGLAPLHGIGSNRMYGVLAASLKLWQSDRLSFYVDDPNVGNVTGGLKTMANEPKRLVKPWFSYKLEHGLASQPEYAEWLQAGVRMLHEQQWPRLIVPAHPWFQGHDVVAKKVPQAAGNVVTLDLTAFLPTIETEDWGDSEGPAHQWVCEAAADDKWLRQQQSMIDVYRISGAKKDKTRSSARVSDKRLVNLYMRSWGVLQPPVVPTGWWNSRIGYARQVLAPYVTKWQDVQALGDPYVVLPHTVAAFDRDARDALAQEQAQAFDRAIPSKELVQSYVSELVNKISVGAA